MNPAKKINTRIVILGGGPAGYTAALRAARSGVSTVLIEDREIGGTCLNRGCIPTKALLKTSEAAYLIGNKSMELGINSSIASLDLKASMARKNRVVKNLRMGLEQLLAGNKVHIIRGKGEVQNPGTIYVRSEAGSEAGQISEDGEISEAGQAKAYPNIVSCEKLIIATGSEPSIPDIPGMNLDGVITSYEALELTDIPESLVIIGAGAIGLEFASLFNSLRSKVTVVEFQNTILPQEDQEMGSELLKIMKRQGIRFGLASQVKEIRETGKLRKIETGLNRVREVEKEFNGVKEAKKGLEVIILDEKGKETLVNARIVLVAAGRKPRSMTPDIVALGVEIREGAIAVNEHMETNIKGVYAAGDVIGGKLLAHLAFAEGKIAVQNALGIESRLNYDAVPSCVYTNPEIASVGLSEEEAKRRGFEVKVGRFDFRKNGRALCLGERDGLVKIVTDKKRGTILGGQIMGAYASELISEITLATALGASAGEVADTIHPHPTLSEAVMEACLDAIC